MNNKNLKSCYIVAGGDIDSLDFYKDLKSQFTICADSGFDFAIEVGLTPSVAIGDFDSISSRGKHLLEEMNIEIIKYPSEKDMTDTELAINYAISKGFQEIIILGGLGNRLDHSLSNIYNLLKYNKHRIKLINSNNEIILLNTDLELEKDNFYYSIIPLTSDGIIVNLYGFHYESENLFIEMGSSIGISNKIKNKRAKIELLSGVGILIKAKDRRINGK